jgi:hypothetical protein
MDADSQTFLAIRPMTSSSLSFLIVTHLPHNDLYVDSIDPSIHVTPITLYDVIRLTWMSVVRCPMRWLTLKRLCSARQAKRC